MTRPTGRPRYKQPRLYPDWVLPDGSTCAFTASPLFTITRTILENDRLAPLDVCEEWCGWSEATGWTPESGRLGHYAFARYVWDHLGPRAPRAWLVPIDATKPLGPGNVRWEVWLKLPDVCLCDDLYRFDCPCPSGLELQQAWHIESGATETETESDEAAVRRRKPRKRRRPAWRR